MVDIWRLYPTLLYRSYKRVVVVLYRVGRLGIACMLSPCYALIWRLYAVVWRVYGGVYRGLCGHGLRVRRVARRWVWRVCTVYVYGVYPLGYSVAYR